MNDSKKNVIDPQDIIDTYGADAARLFILSDSPPERDLEWTEKGIEGAWKFINKLHRTISQLQPNLPEYGSTAPESFTDTAKELRKTSHKITKNISENIENFHLNKAVAHIHELSNTISSYKNNDWALRESLEILIKLINPIMPHLAEELWSMLGATTLLTEESWPEINKSLLTSNTFTIGVQVNGKVRASITLATNANQELVEKTALSEPNVQRAMEGKSLRKFIYIPGKIVNVVAK